ncbi:peptidoglycan-binding protein [Streptomyces sp. MUSC 14]|uniref:peptidoglycan-binding protein n=1 Tax=Streptomyces sp. MUSC 14 TaxID=1354889 RepID=UPI0009A0E034|nr:peptidoglycan-binding protein [Streptomyces sp. MUSC 14]
MTAPVFVGRRTPPGRPVGRPAACGLVAAAAVALLGAAAPAAALPVARPAVQRPHVHAGNGPDTPQGGRSGLHGKSAGPANPANVPATTRAEIINRAKVWVAAKVPYSMSTYWSDGYRQDCSGYVSMAWNLGTNEWTGSLGSFGVKITKEELEPGDILLYHNPDNPEKGSHVVIFGGWTDYTHGSYTIYEQTPPNARSQPTPYPYWSNADKYVPYRYKGVTPATAGAPADDGKGRARHLVRSAATGHPARPASHGVPGYPGRAFFLPGAENDHVTQLGRRLVEKGFGRFYATGPGPVWSEADRRAVEAFQRAQGWRGGAADGYPGPETWRRLFLTAGPDHVTGI